MIPPPVDLIMATFGAREAVDRCITSLFEVDSGYPFRLTIFDNLASKDDGTREMLRRLSKGRSNFEVVYSAENMGHGHCLDYLVAHTGNPVIVALDSDLIFTPEAAGWLKAIVDTLQGDVKICGNIMHALRPDAFSGVWLSRVLPMVMGVERKFLGHWGLRFAPCRWTARFEPCPYPIHMAEEEYRHFAWGAMPPWFLKRRNRKTGTDRTAGSAPFFEFRGDVGWQFYFVLGACGPQRIAPLPRIVNEHVVHVGHQSLTQVVERRKKIMRKVTVYRKTDQPPVHGEVGSMKALEREGKCLSLSNARIGNSPDYLRMVSVPWTNVDIIVIDDTGQTIPSPKVEKPKTDEGDRSECPQANRPDHGENVPVKDVPSA
ncbi:MAG: glycosyltransferase family 2 protein [Planctomycetes bacterium]|nr:glycosyltransferase family 2 protein [Planctomycetota bacterium]